MQQRFSASTGIHYLVGLGLCDISVALLSSTLSITADMCPTICVFEQTSTSGGKKWLVQPGDLGWRTEWTKEDSRVIWEVPQDRLFNKVRRPLLPCLVVFRTSIDG